MSEQMPPVLCGPVATWSKTVRFMGVTTGTPVVVESRPAPGGPWQTCAAGPASGFDARLPITAVLNAGDVLRSSINGGAVGTREVPVIDAPPQLGQVSISTYLYRCAQCVRVDAALPDATVVIADAAGNEIGRADASGAAPDSPTTGTAQITLTRRVSDADAFLQAHQEVPGRASTPARSMAPDDPSPRAEPGTRLLPPPTLAHPVRRCDPLIVLGSLLPGSEITITRAAGDATVLAFGETEQIWVQPFDKIEKVSFKQAMRGRCELSGDTGSTDVVDPPIPPPDLPRSICEGSTTVPMSGLLVGATVTVHVDHADGTFDERTTIAMQESWSPDLGMQVHGVSVKAKQSRCGATSVWGRAATVVPAPATLPSPEVVEPVYDCASVVLVAGTHGGGLVEVWAKNAGWSGMVGWAITREGSTPVGVSALADGMILWATETACGLQVQGHDHPVTAPPGRLPAPRVGAAGRGATAVGVFGTISGACVELFAGAVWLASAVALGDRATLTLPAPLSGGQGDSGLMARQWICDARTLSDPSRRVPYGRPMVLTQHNDNSRTGANIEESTLSPSTIGKLHRVGFFEVDGQVYAQPLFVGGLDMGPAGIHDVLYVATMDNSVYALDATTGKVLWSRTQLATPRQAASIYSGYADISGPVGIVSTPVISLARGRVYLVTTEDQPLRHRLWGIDLVDPSNVQLTEVAGAASGVTFRSDWQLQRPALALANERIYVGFGAYGDHFDYHGWLLAYDAGTLAFVGAFVSSQAAGQAGIWQAGQGPAIDEQGRLYLSTGNSRKDAPPDPAKGNYGMCFLQLDADADLIRHWLVDNPSVDPGQSAAESLSNRDADLGSAGPMLPPGSTLMLGGGKPGWFYLLDRATFTTVQEFEVAPRNDPAVEDGLTLPPIPHEARPFRHIHGSPVYWSDGGSGGRGWVFVWPENDFLKSYEFRPGQAAPLSTSKAARSSDTSPPLGTTTGTMPGGMLSVSADGTSGGLVWASHTQRDDANQALVTGVCEAYDATSLGAPLWSTWGKDDYLFAKFCPPTVAGGRLYLSTFGLGKLPGGKFGILVYGT